MHCQRRSKWALQGASGSGAQPTHELCALLIRLQRDPPARQPAGGAPPCDQCLTPPARLSSRASRLTPWLLNAAPTWVCTCYRP